MSGTELLQHSKLNCIVWHRAFARLQIELYRVVNYDKKWSTKWLYFGIFFNFTNIS